MSCEALFKRMGFECRLFAEGVYRVFTPMSFPSGEPIGMYFADHGNIVRVSDNADTIFHLHSVGLDFGDKKKWRGVSHIAKTFGMSLESNGELTGVALPGAAAGLVSRYLGAMLAIADLERDMRSITPELANYIDEVELHLRNWKPDAVLLKQVSVTGHSGRIHAFHFKLGDELIEAARPNSKRTGSILRKVADMRNSTNPVPMMVVMDDREDGERAAAETDILSTLVRVLPFSRLSRNLSGAPDFHEPDVRQ